MSDTSGRPTALSQLEGGAHGRRLEGREKRFISAPSFMPQVFLA